MTEERDERLGRALRSLDVPEHGPDFYPRLLARLEEETARHPGSPRRPRLTSPFVLSAMAAALVLIAVATTTVLRGDGARRPGGEPELITASVVRSKVAGALASLDTLEGEIALECAIAYGPCRPPEAGGRTTLRWSFVTDAAGDERITGIGTTDDMAIDTSARTSRSLRDDGSGLGGYEAANLPAGPPDFSGATSALRRELGSVVRAFVTDTSDAPVTDTVEQGRDAWRLVTPVEVDKLAGPGNAGDQIEVVVDRQSGFPLRVTESLQGQFLHEVRLSGLVADKPVDPSRFVLDFPPGVEVFHQDLGFRRVTLDEAAALVGYRPILPTAVPTGFEIADITAAAQGAGTGMEGMNPRAAGVVSVAYRSGFDQIVVSTRRAGGSPSCADLSEPIQQDCWGDPLSSGEGFVDEPQPFVVGGGALAGAKAALVVSPRGVPHVWSIDDRLVVTVGGDASADELRRMAESFSPR